MAQFNGAGPVTNGLMFCIDGSNPKSYGGTGSSITDVSGNLPPSTSYLTPVMEDGAFVIDNVNSSGINVTSSNFAGLTDFSIEVVFRLTGSHRAYNGALITSGNWNSHHWALSLNSTNSAIQTRNPAATYTYAFNTTDWYHLVYCRTGSSLSFTVNGVTGTPIVSTANIPLSSDSVNTALGRETYANGYFVLNGRIALTRIYSRSLTVDERLQNFASIRSRYGI